MNVHTQLRRWSLLSFQGNSFSFHCLIMGAVTLSKSSFVQNRVPPRPFRVFICVTILPLNSFLPAVTPLAQPLYLS